MEGWRSEPMCRVQLFIQSDAARDTVDELAREGIAEFVDLNADKSALQRRFVNEVKRCDDMERKIRYFADQVRKLKIEVPINAEFVENEDQYKLDDLESRFEDLEKELKEMSKGQEMLDKNYNELVEMHHVLAKDAGFFSESEASGLRPEDADDSAAPLVPGRGYAAQPKNTNLGFTTGVILTEKMPNFERVVFRALRGNMFMKHADVSETIIDPVSGDEVKKTAFIIFFSGERARLKVKKICESFHANVYACPENPVEREQTMIQLSARLEDMHRVLDRSNEHRRELLSKVALEVEAWSRKVKKEKAVFHTLNLFNYDITRKALMAEAWVPVDEQDRVHRALRRGSERSGAVVPPVMTVVDTREKHPTYFKPNRFLKPYQDMTESYGVPRYQEINPAIVTAMTFPFLFAIMYGDVVHGSIMTIAAALMCIFEKRLEKMKLGEVVMMAFGGRYLILLMGIFSIYTGLLYNEWLSRPMNLFGTAWYYPYGSDTAVKLAGYTYGFGVDPVWKDTITELAYYNSLKMKMSIIFGVSHMSIGLICKLLNALHFKHYKDIFCEWIPEVIFLMAMFGYLVIVIFIKWFTDFVAENKGAPSLITLLIQMFLAPGTIEDPLFEHQGVVQIALVLSMVVCIPWLLLPKPLLELRAHKQKMRYQTLDDDVEQSGGDDGHGHGGEGFQFGEVMVHQIIHTIEYALGTISNTASYLRLWALSLAHSELANVFWQKVLIGRIGEGGMISMGLQVFAGAGAFFGATIGVLLIMESLSAFLHALRLHWVEFQNKFYAGDGRKFKPFSYAAVLRPNDE